MKKYLFENANTKLKEIDYKNQKVFNRFEKVVLCLIALIHIVSLIAMYFNSTYSIYLYEQMKDNYITSKFIELSILVNQSLIVGIENKSQQNML